MKPKLEVAFEVALTAMCKLGKQPRLTNMHAHKDAHSMHTCTQTKHTETITRTNKHRLAGTQTATQTETPVGVKPEVAVAAECCHLFDQRLNYEPRQFPNHFMMSQEVFVWHIRWW